MENTSTSWSDHGQLAERRSRVRRALVAMAAGGVQEAVAQPFGFGVGEFAVEAEQFHPDQQVMGDEDDDSQAALMAKV